MTPVVSMTPAVVVALPTPSPPTIYVDVPMANPTRGVGVEVPIPTTPVFVIMKFVCVEEPTTNEGPEPMLFGFTERSAHGEVEPMPRRPILSNLIYSENVLGPFLVEKVSADVVEFAFVRTPAIRAREVEAPSLPSPTKRRPTPRLFAAEELARCPSVSTSTIEEFSLSITYAESAGIPMSDVVANRLNVPGPWENRPVGPTWIPFPT